MKKIERTILRVKIWCLANGPRNYFRMQKAVKYIQFLQQVKDLLG